jgi:hypothetical protein
VRLVSATTSAGNLLSNHASTLEAGDSESDQLSDNHPERRRTLTDCHDHRVQVRPQISRRLECPLMTVTIPADRLIGCELGTLAGR